MIAVNYSQVRENMKTYMDKATNDFETIIVTRKDKNVVIISEEAYNNRYEVSIKDELTGLYNRRGYDADCELIKKDKSLMEYVLIMMIGK